MIQFNFADRYAEAGLTPTPETIAMRQAPADSIVENATNAMILDLVGAYYGSPIINLVWLRDEFAKKDTSFSLVNNDREIRIIAAYILGCLVANGDPVAILAVLSGGVSGLRYPTEAIWLLQETKSALLINSIDQRKPTEINPEIIDTTNLDLSEKIASIPANDWGKLASILQNIFTETENIIKTISSESISALEALDKNVRYQREESQMLWWVFGGYSRSLRRNFKTFGTQQAAIIGALDLGALTVESELGPVAAPAMLERIITLAKKPKSGALLDLATAIDGLSSTDLEQVKIFDEKIPPRLAPITAAISLARTIGIGLWHKRFEEKTGLEVTVSLDPMVMGEQLYYEYLLGQQL